MLCALAKSSPSFALNRKSPEFGCGFAALSPNIVVTSTNVITPLTNWTPVVTNTFSGGNFAFTNAINTAEPTRFYNMKTP